MRRALLELLAPRVCVVCGVEGGHFCDEHSDYSRHVNDTCISCSKYSPLGLCTYCSSLQYFDEFYAVRKYQGSVIDALRRIKYSRDLYLAKDIAKECGVVASELDFDFVTFVPAGRSRKRQRGFDQAEVIAKSVALKSKNIDLKRLITRRDDTSVTELNRQERIKKTQNMYESSREINNKCVLLIDDVVSTGATIDACSKLLIEAGASRVIVLVYAVNLRKK